MVLGLTLAENLPAEGTDTDTDTGRYAGMDNGPQGIGITGMENTLLVSRVPANIHKEYK